MKPNQLTLAACAGALLLVTACEKKSESGNAQPTARTDIPEKIVEITANDQMKFSVTDFEVKPGQKVSVTLKNIGTAPKISMGHNFVLLDKNTDAAKFVEAGQTQMANDFIPPELKNKVLAHTKLLGPGESDTITFTAPRIASSYTYICPFPGHYALGMKGVMTVQ